MRVCCRVGGGGWGVGDWGVGVSLSYLVLSFLLPVKPALLPLGLKEPFVHSLVLPFSSWLCYFYLVTGSRLLAVSY